MSYDNDNVNIPAPETATDSGPAPAQGVPAPVQPLQGPEMHEGVQVADASLDEARAWEVLEEEAEEASYEEEAEYEAEAAEEASADDAPEAEMSEATESASAEASSANSAEVAGSSAAASSGISSAWLWGGLAVAAGAAAASGGGNSEPATPDAPSVALDEDSGTAGDGISNSGVFNVTGLDNDTDWEYSVDGGTTWTAGTGSSFTLAESGDYDVVVRQSRGEKVSDNSATLSVTLDFEAPVISSGDTASIDENAEPGVVYETVAEDAATLTYTLSEDSAEGLTIDSETGAVSIDASPDFESVESYAFTVVATDVAGNTAEQAVTLSVNNLDEEAPAITSSATVDDVVEGIGANAVASQVIYTVTSTDDADTATGDTVYSLKDGSDPALSIDPASGAVTLTEVPDFETQSVYNFTVVATDQAGNFSEQSLSLNITDLEEVPPTYVGMVGDSATDTITLTFSEALTSDPLPDVANFTVSQGGSALTIETLEVSGSDIILNLAANSLAAASVQVSYTPGEGNNVADIVGNEAGSFIQMVVSDGYIRGAQVYLDVDGDGIADPDELIEGATTDENGQVIIKGDVGEGTLLIVGGVNTDTGAVNKLVLKTASGSTTANPLTTLVETVKETLRNSGESEDNAEAIVAGALGITLAEGQSLQNYDPLSDTSDSALAARKAVATVAVVLATAADAAEAAEGGDAVATVNSVTANIATQLVAAQTAATPSTVTFDENTVNTVVAGTGVTVDAAAVAGTATAISTTDDVTVIVTEQAKATDKVAPGAPSLSLDEGSESGKSLTDGITNKANLKIYVDFEETKTDGSAVVAGDIVEVFLGGQTFEATVTLADIKAGGVAVDVGQQTDGFLSFTAQITDKAGNASELATGLVVTVDLTNPNITSGGTANIDEDDDNEAVLVYQAAASDDTAVSFELADGADSALSINAETGAVTLANPDHETKASYDFTVVATDAAGNKSEQAVSLTLNDLDESAPVITSDAVATMIDENSGAGQVVYETTVDDSGDITSGLSYTLESDSSDLTINQATGAVTLTPDPDFETSGNYTFTVTVTDGAGFSDSLEVNLDINNLDEVAPKITSLDTVDSIKENSGAGQVIYQATATDLGDTSDGVMFSLSQDSAAGLTINEETGEVTLTDNPNFEALQVNGTASYSFTVIATDKAGNSAQQALTLTIENVDESAPTITSSDTAQAVDENSGPNQPIYTATATDTGDVESGLTYTLADDLDGALTINGESGVVTLTVDPNFETAPSYNFTVVATDGEGNEDEQAVSLAINNVDEVAPEISSGGTATAIAENSGGGTVIYQTQATDTDTEGLTSSITYTLGGTDEALFSINETTGAVTLLADADFETQPSYSFTVIATDTAGNESEQAVTLNVNNVDEVAPTFTSGSSVDPIDENNEEGVLVYTASADDNDFVSGGITYSLKEPVTGISVDADSGEVRLTVSADHETAAQQSFSFTIVATDGAGNKSEQALTLNINDVDDADPVIVSPGQFNALTQTPYVYQVVADDTDDVSDGVSYSLDPTSADAGLLSIDAEDGVVSVKSGLVDPAIKASYSFTVVATDAAGNTASKAVTVSVGAAVLTSVNATIAGTDVLPESFVLDGGTSSITGGTGTDIFVVTAAAGSATTITDFGATQDDTDLLDFSYALIEAGYASSNDNGAQVAEGLAVQSLDTQIDNLASIQQNDATYDNTYGILVDAANGTLTGYYDSDASLGTVNMVTFSVNVGNAAQTATSDNVTAQVITGPAFLSGTSAEDIVENTASGAVVYTASVELEPGITATYSLAPGVENLFSINAESGVVTLLESPDFETTQGYSFTVIAATSDGLESRQTVNLKVTNVDDTAPDWLSETSFVSITGTPFLYQAEATDTDGPNDIVSYSLDPTSADFDSLTIESDTGIVTLKSGLLDPTVQDTYSFTVVATDEAGNEAKRSVETTLSATTDVQGPGVIQQGGIEVLDTDNLDGTYTLEFFVDLSVAESLPLVGSFDLVINYDSLELLPIESADFTHNPQFAVSVNDTVSGQATVGGFLFNPGGGYYDAAGDVPLTSVTVTPTAVTNITFTISNVILENDNAQLFDQADTVVIYGDPVSIVGSDANESFVLSGGDVTVSGAGGIDLYVITETTGDQVFITDFDVENDGIDMSALLLGLEYTGLLEQGVTSPADGLVSYIDADASVFNLIAQNSVTLDNVFGAVVGDGVITGFYDANSLAGEVDIQTFELTVGPGVTADILANPEDNGLLAALNGFIA